MARFVRDWCGGTPCVPVFPTKGVEIVSFVGGKDRFVIVDVRDETVIIDVGASADKFEEFAPVAQKVLDTVKWDSP